MRNPWWWWSLSPEGIGQFVAILAVLAIQQIVTDGEAWLPVKAGVKAGPDFGHGGR
jgi:hypothetical protein